MPSGCKCQASDAYRQKPTFACPTSDRPATMTGQADTETPGLLVRRGGGWVGGWVHLGRSAAPPAGDIRLPHCCCPVTSSHLPLQGSGVFCGFYGTVSPSGAGTPTGIREIAPIFLNW